jgi:large subunit ribosomal protein L7/L12
MHVENRLSFVRIPMWRRAIITLFCGATMMASRFMLRVSKRALFTPTSCIHKCFFSSAPAESFRSPRVEELYTKMTALPVEDVNLIGELLSEKLGIPIPDFNAPPATAAVEQEEEEAVVVEEKTLFDLKLMAYDAKAKIKVIKEVRAIAGLGLKEAKELVEGAPKVIKKDIKKEEAEELQKKLEEVGATIEVS